MNDLGYMSVCGGGEEGEEEKNHYKASFFDMIGLGCVCVCVTKMER